LPKHAVPRHVTNREHREPKLAELHVELVAAEREVWSGDGTIVIAKTVEGDIGIQPGHEPFLGVLANGVVRIRTTDGQEVRAAVHGGFLSIANDTVSVLAEAAELAEEIDVSRAEQALQATTDADDVVGVARRQRAEVRIRAASGR
jgi:F-type H+-transporting ATPase subunit epsilon